MLKKQNMGKAVLLLAFLALSFSNCSKKNEVSKDSYEYFSANLKSSMSYADIIASFGNPDRDLGSGIHIYVYELKDGTGIWIGYTDRILYARHMSSTHSGAQLLHTII
jgi:hypothetical protein